MITLDCCLILYISAELDQPSFSLETNFYKKFKNLTVFTQNVNKYALLRDRL